MAGASCIGTCKAVFVPLRQSFTHVSLIRYPKFPDKENSGADSNVNRAAGASGTQITPASASLATRQAAILLVQQQQQQGQHRHPASRSSLDSTISSSGQSETNTNS